jgi:hypothetical protein
MGRNIKEKIKSMNKPLFTPVVDATVPQKIWDHEAILISYKKNPIPDNRHVNRKRQLIIVESGGFLTNAPKTPYECLMHQIRAFPDIVLTLDIPPKRLQEKTGKEPTLQDKREAVRITNLNAKIALKLRERFIEEYDWNFELMGVIQSYDMRSMINSTYYLKDLDYGMYAFGSSPTKGRTLIDKELAIMYLKEIREIIGKEAWLHWLGVMSVGLLKEAKPYITSFDAASITRLAAYGKVWGGKSPYYDILNIKGFNNAITTYERELWNY